MERKTEYEKTNFTIDEIRKRKEKWKNSFDWLKT